MSTANLEYDQPSHIREHIRRIGKEHSALARHFDKAIHTGTFCSYQPDRPFPWKL